ncbi:hypothetical protein F0267_01860 [Vibrio coralliilyticus]|uniref:Uncharacterized protein n=2 Tax=Vibrio TaxID=662 RepID=A0AAU9QSY6_9VIBR|nr:MULTISPECIES: hypothetical protein [Vibrio]MCZ2799069.1 hypothetical protein [Vibrio alginolyticus]NOH36970.1 hypothetical protein [Vibrio coralliilyticus]CAH1588027.1 conserved hypothetical protein [Vibrio jasicida]CAH1599950.1 conserved hypothetical protein [Vibrio jasicida]
MNGWVILSQSHEVHSGITFDKSTQGLLPLADSTDNKYGQHMHNQPAFISNLESKFRQTNEKLRLELVYWRKQLNESCQELAMFNKEQKSVEDDLMWRFDTKSIDHKKGLSIQKKYLEEVVKHNRHMIEIREKEFRRVGGFICSLRADAYNHKIEMKSFNNESTTIDYHS